MFPGLCFLLTFPKWKTLLWTYWEAKEEKIYMNIMMMGFSWLRKVHIKKYMHELFTGDVRFHFGTQISNSKNGWVDCVLFLPLLRMHYYLFLILGACRHQAEYHNHNPRLTRNAVLNLLLLKMFKPRKKLWKLTISFYLLFLLFYELIDSRVVGGSSRHTYFRS